MKKDILLVATKIIYSLMILGTIITMFIVYKDINNKFTIKFVIGYVIFVFFFIFYMFITTILKLRRLRWADIKKRMFKFIITFILLGALGYGTDYFFRPSKIDLSKNVSIAFGLAFGTSFMDVIFLKKKNLYEN